jgi:hypothetical protein
LGAVAIVQVLSCLFWVGQGTLVSRVGELQDKLTC